MQQANLQQTVLVVDDTPENIMIMTEILRDLYRVKAATNGRKALSIAESENPPDIIEYRKHKHPIPQNQEVSTRPKYPSLIPAIV